MNTADTYFYNDESWRDAASAGTLVEKPNLTNYTFVYDGTEQSVSLPADIEHCTLGGTTSATDVGSYTATVTLEDGYKWSDGSDSNPISLTWEITPAQLTATPSASELAFNDPSLVDYSGVTWTAYDFEGKALAWSTEPDIALYDSDGSPVDEVTQAGSYYLRASGGVLEDSSYEVAAYEDCVIIVGELEKVTPPTATSAEFTYDAEAQPATIEPAPSDDDPYTISYVRQSDKTTYDAAGAINAGTYDIVASLKDTTVSVWSLQDGSTTPADQTLGTVAIGKAKVTVGVTQIEFEIDDTYINQYPFSSYITLTYTLGSAAQTVITGADSDEATAAFGEGYTAPGVSTLTGTGEGNNTAGTEYTVDTSTPFGEYTAQVTGGEAENFEFDTSSTSTLTIKWYGYCVDKIPEDVSFGYNSTQQGVDTSEYGDRVWFYLEESGDNRQNQKDTVLGGTNAGTYTFYAIPAVSSSWPRSAGYGYNGRTQISFTVTITPASLPATYVSESVAADQTPALQVAIDEDDLYGRDTIEDNVSAYPTVSVPDEAKGDNGLLKEGDYTLTPEGGTLIPPTGSEEPNYVFEYVPGTLTVTAAEGTGSTPATQDEIDALKGDVTSAQTTLDSVVVSADGSDVATDAKWVTQAVHDALAEAIQSASDVANSSSPTAAAVAEAKAALDSALATFEAAEQSGTKTDETTTGPGPVVDNPNGGGNGGGNTGGSKLTKQTIKAKKSVKAKKGKAKIKVKGAKTALKVTAKGKAKKALKIKVKKGKIIVKAKKKGTFKIKVYAAASSKYAKSNTLKIKVKVK